MIDRLRDVLEAIGPPVTSVELAEIIWMAGHLPDSAGEAADASEEVTIGSAFDAAGQRGAVPGPDATETPTLPMAREVEADAGGGHPLYPLRPELAAGTDSSPVLVPTAPMLQRPLSLQRSLRPFKRKVMAWQDQVVDEAATAARIAEHGRNPPWIPVLVPARERWLRLSVVIDGSKAMAIWRPLADELRELMLGLGAFRDVRVWFMADVAGRLGIRASPGGPVQAPAALVDPTGRQLTAVLSDCSGPHWWSGRMAPAVHSWATHGPTAILQPLPERLWRRTAAPTTPGQAVLSRPGGPNTELRFVPHDGVVPRRGDAVPVPVVELSAEWLGDWAMLVAASGGPRDTAVTYLSPRAPRPRKTPVTAERDLPVPERVRRFIAAASPSAVELSGHVAVSVPSLPIMRLIQRRILPASRPADLAEMLLSGLLSPVDAVPGLYEFLPGARAELLELLPRHESLATADTLERVSVEIQERAGTAAQIFRAAMLVPAGTGTAATLAEQRPFAFVSTEALSILTRRTVPAAEVSTPSGWPSQVQESPAFPASPDALVAPELLRSDHEASIPTSGDTVARKREPGIADTPAPTPGSQPIPFPQWPAITLWGPPGSGKRTFVTALYIALAKSDIGARMWAADDASTDALITWTSRLTRDRTFPEAPERDQRHFWIINQEITETARRFLRRDLTTTTVFESSLTILDDSDASEREQDDVIDDLAASAGIMYVFDIFTELSRRDAYARLSSACLRLAHRGHTSGKMPHYIAVCLTKFDHPDIYRHARNWGFKSYRIDDPYLSPRVEDEDAQELLRRLCTEFGLADAERIPSLLQAYFQSDRIKYFITSSIGFHVSQSVGRFTETDFMNVIPSSGNEQLRIRGPVHPINAAEPVIWLNRQINATDHAAAARRARR